ncbi:MAG: hypothetical protein ACKO7W_01400 [Elainella sp.]
MKSNQPKSTARPPAVQPVAPAASVPISVYRELAAELQATRAMVDSLNGKTQQLNRENQLLRQEMQRIIHSVLSLQPWVNGLPDPTPDPARPTWEETAAASAIAANLRSAHEPHGAAHSEPVVPEPGLATNSHKTSRLGGLWLVLTILAIIVGAFGAGFLLMRPLLPTVSPEASPEASPHTSPISPTAPTSPVKPLNPPPAQP